MANYGLDKWKAEQEKRRYSIKEQQVSDFIENFPGPPVSYSDDNDTETPSVRLMKHGIEDMKNRKFRENKTSISISQVMDRIEKLLLEKNRKYGDSAINPVRIFSQADSLEQLKVRIDDKLSRVSHAQLDEDEEVVLDLIGYLVLYLVALEIGD